MKKETVRGIVKNLNDVALHAATRSTVEAACGWVLYQPKIPQELRKETEDKE